MANKYVAGGITAVLAIGGAYVTGRMQGAPETGLQRCEAVAHIDPKKPKANDMEDLVGRAATAAHIELYSSDKNEVIASAEQAYRIGTGNEDPNTLTPAVGMSLCVVIDLATGERREQIPTFQFTPPLEPKQ